MLNSLEVLQVGGGIRTGRRVPGMTVKERLMRRAEFPRFEQRKTSSSQSGNKHVIRYAVSAVDRYGQKIVVDEGFRGAGQAKAAAEFVGQKFGLSERHRAKGRDATVEEYNPLAV